jgi:hypothetical protein
LVVYELKVVSSFEFKRRWSEGTPPEAILLQTLTQLHLTDAAYGFVVPFDPDAWALRPPYRVDRFPEVEAEIRKRAAAFMLDIAAGREPSPDYARDAGLIAARFRNSTPDKVIDLRGDNRAAELCHQYLDIADKSKALAELREAVTAELQSKIGDAEIAQVDGFSSVTFRRIDRRAYQVPATSYRKLRVIAEKDEEDAT